MARLSDAQKRYIVKALACGGGQSEIGRRCKEIWGIEIERSQVHYYHPEYSDGLAERWKSLYRETREEYIREVDSIPCRHQGYRLRQIQRLIEQAFDSKDYPEAARMLELAAKESGGLFTNVRRGRFVDKEDADREVTPASFPGIFVVGPPEINDMIRPPHATPFQLGRGRSEES